MDDRRADRFFLLLIDGMADEPLAELDGRTPMEVASTPNMDLVAARGEMGTARTIPPGLPPGSDVANLSVLGYDPRRYYTGRSPLEALSMGLELTPDDATLRCNLVTISENDEVRPGSGEGTRFEARKMLDYSAGEISTSEAGKLIRECQARLGTHRFSFHPGISYRHILLWRGGRESIGDLQTTPPHDILNQTIGEHLPAGSSAPAILELMRKSTGFLRGHRINLHRIERGLSPANSIWLWGQGTRPHLPAFVERFGIRGSVISAVDLLRGIGLAAGLRPVTVEGATGRIDTNFAGKARAAIRCLEGDSDFVFLHLEAADEAAHQGDLETKVRAIEYADRRVLEPVLERIGDGRLSVMIMADHPTPLSTRTHSRRPVPFLICRRGAWSIPGCPPDSTGGFSEKQAERAGLFFEDASRLMGYFLTGKCDL